MYGDTHAGPARGSPLAVYTPSQFSTMHRFVGGDKVPLANLFVSMLQAVDVPVERFADSTGPLSDLRRAT